MIFLGCLYNRVDENKILKLSNTGLQNAVNTYQLTLIDGLNKNLKKPVDIINVLPVGTWPKNYNKFKLDTKEWSYNESNNREIGSINIPFIKQIVRAIKIKKLLRKLEDDQDIIIYSTYMPFLNAIYKLDKKHKVTLIVTDLPEYYDLCKTNRIKKNLRNINNKFIYKYLERVDNFVLLTDAMKYPLKVGNRPYVVIEGIAHENKVFIESKNTDSKVILYTGTLNYKFGIKKLLDAFHLIDKSNYELWICGSGEAEKDIKYLSNIDKRIRYLGYVTKEEIFKLQQKATLLINPRSNEGEYTKYSFPSKTMEYMASGKPVLMYKLDGIPDEYDDYVYYVCDNSVETLKDKIIEICEKNDLERYEFGLRAKKFILEEKNNNIQARKIIDMIGREHE